MKNLKKVLALVTMFTMLLGVAVSAGTLYPDVDDAASYAEAVETLNVLSIMIGDDKGNFNPDASITRAEAAAIVVRVKNLGNAASAAGGTNFTDVAADHWAAGYINLAEQSGIINGYGDGTFGPSDPVTYEQIIKMIVAALGRTPEAEAKGGYPSGYLIVAAQEDINLGVAVTAGAEAPRAAVARLVFNALEVDVMEQKSYTPGEEKFEVVEGKNLLKNYLKVSKFEGVIESTYLSEGKIAEDDAKTIKIAGEDLYEGETNAAAFLGYNVSAYAKADENDDLVLLGVAKKAGKNDVLTLEFSDIAAADIAGETIEYYETASSSKTTEIKVAFDKCFFNGGVDSDDMVEAFLADAGASVAKTGVLTLIDNDKEEGYDVVMLKDSTSDAVVGAIDAEDMILEDRAGNEIDLDLEDEKLLINFYKADGTAAEFADIAEGNVLTMYENAKGNIISVYISDVKVEGKITETAVLSNGATAYTIGNADYTKKGAVSLKVGDEGTFFINVEGKIVDKVATAASGTYAYLYKAIIDNTDINGSTIEMKYLTSDGEWVNNTLASTVTVVNDGGDATTLKMADLGTKGAAFETALLGFLNVTKVQNEDGEGNPIADSFKVTEIETGDDRVFQFGLDNEGKINKLYIGAGEKNDTNNLSVDETVTGKEYNAGQKKLGKLFFEDETIIFNVKADGDGDPTISEEKDITVTKASALFVDGVEYVKVVGYDCENSIPAIAVAYNNGSTILSGTNLLVITRKSTTTDANGNTVTKLYGLQQGEEVSGTLETGCEVLDAQNDDYGVNNLKAGDVVIFSLNNGAIDNIRVLQSYAALDLTVGTVSVDLADDLAVNYFGYVASKDNGQLWLTQGFGGAALEEDRDEVSFPLNASGINVYEINTSKSTPSFDVISVAKIKATKGYNKEAHWAYVRVYDDAVVDIVVYKAVTPYEETAEVPVVSFEGGKLVLTSEEDATIYYSKNDGDFAKYTAALTVAEDDTIVAYAVVEGKNDSALMAEYTVTAEDLVVEEEIPAE